MPAEQGGAPAASFTESQWHQALGELANFLGHFYGENGVMEEHMRNTDAEGHLNLDEMWPETLELARAFIAYAQRFDAEHGVEGAGSRFRRDNQQLE